MNLGYFLNETKILFKRYGYKKVVVWQDAKQPRYGLKKSNVHLPGKMGCYLFIVTPFC